MCGVLGKSNSKLSAANAYAYEKNEIILASCTHTHTHRIDEEEIKDDEFSVKWKRFGKSLNGEE